ncbi:MAG: helix-turn-helix transcriptional regulator [Paracoccus sp. (in: a-proteobacteria)]|nr:helix-turn-helix transcriptional regulator [Paracoccus sp. (in: a-proteobacteria)]
MSRKRDRTRKELSDFLRSRRERLDPADVGLPATGRRRTPGLRREEVAALSGVGLAWYTWLEQGRDIGVSSTFLDNLARVLRLDAAERRYLFFLTQNRAPAEPGKTWCIVPPVIHRLMADLTLRPAYVINLRWDVLAWNKAADRIFGFSAYKPEERNFLWLAFADQTYRTLLDPWEDQARQILSHFRRDFARATHEPDILALIKTLEVVDTDFKSWWEEQNIRNPYSGQRRINIGDAGAICFDHSMLTIDEDRHLRLIYLAPVEDGDHKERFEAWLKVDDSV